MRGLRGLIQWGDRQRYDLDSEIGTDELMIRCRQMPNSIKDKAVRLNEDGMTIRSQMYGLCPMAMGLRDSGASATSNCTQLSTTEYFSYLHDIVPCIST